MFEIDKIIQSPMFNGYCDPLVTPLAIAGAVASVAGAATATVASVNQARFERDVAKRGAAIESQKAEIELDRIERERERRIASARASGGASGVGIQSGTPLGLLGQIAFQSAEDVAIQRTIGSERVSQQLIAAQGAKTRGQTALLGGALDTVGKAARGGTSIASTL